MGVYISQVIKRQRVEDDTVIELLQKLEEIGGVSVSQKFMLSLKKNKITIVSIVIIKNHFHNSMLLIEHFP